MKTPTTTIHDKDQDAKLAASKKAIVYMLNRIRENPKLAYHTGEGTQAFRLLTEAAAMLYSEPPEKVFAFYAEAPNGKEE